MKTLVHRISTDPEYTKVFRWGKLIAITGGAQAIVQVMSLACGILIIRLLPTKEYALYTITNAMLGTMTLLADSGISNGVISHGGRVWPDKKQLGIVLATGLDLRKKFAISSFLIIIPILIYLLSQHGASLAISFLIAACLVPSFLANLSDTLLEIVPKLNLNIKPLQKNQVNVSIGRLLMSGAFIFFFPFAYTAIIAGGVPRAIGNIKLRRIVYSTVERDEPDEVIKKDMLKNIKRTLPISIYYCFSGQISIWLISFFGKTTTIAQIGALGRIALILNIFSIMFGTLIIPRFSKLANNKYILLNYSLKIVGGTIILAILVVSVVYFFSDEFLFLLGKNYQGLNKELELCITGSCINLLAGITFGLYACRSWMIPPVLVIGIDVLGIIFGIKFFNIYSLDGILVFNIFTMSTLFLSNLIYLFYKIFKEQKDFF